ncbi:GSCFA domain-containing protein [Gluconacetobacter diazotrophicus]|uniref:GSCFA domain-containing protein n=3 Tax=Gluconacetobacter diazotrophicus TaxID=33996 RepID=A9HMT7_GLUDA|nr:GSCFA domain-containing protein [Gluconacetobacter diazotrophicus]MBB2156300.1 hypothetical protein [Gluconacetobacter diazotrophicus]CAP56349.1 hypothetical protein GDI2406 [Gluconacetobacter diazotrophicus PA1 5]
MSPEPKGVFKDDDYDFINFRVSEIVDDMQAAIMTICEANPVSRFILTVSPVPLIATYCNRHVLVSNTYSKACLRVAAEELSMSIPDVAYFPSYEIIAGLTTAPGYYLSGLRSISPFGIEHVMRAFFLGIASTNFSILTLG